MQWYANEPAAANVVENFPLASTFALLLIDASSNVIVCAVESLFVHSTEPPAFAVDGSGSNLKFLIETAVVPPPAAVAGAEVGAAVGAAVAAVPEHAPNAIAATATSAVSRTIRTKQSSKVNFPDGPANQHRTRELLWYDHVAASGFPASIARAALP